MKFLFEKDFDFSKLTELEHQYLNHVVYLDYLYSKKKDDDDDSTFDLMMDWTHILMKVDPQWGTMENEWDDTEFEKKFDLIKGLELIQFLRNSKKEFCWDVYCILYDSYCVDPKDFDVKEKMEMFKFLFNLFEKEMGEPSLTATE